MGIGEMGEKIAQENNCLGVAQQLVSGDRNNDYGHPIHDFSRTALIWTAILKNKLKDGEVVTTEDVPLMMVGVKISREVNKHKQDNLVDGCGYFRTLEMVHDYREQQEIQKAPLSHVSDTVIT
jgi:hypothetical protein